MKKLLNSSELTAINGGLRYENGIAVSDIICAAPGYYGKNAYYPKCVGFGCSATPPREKTFLESLAEQLKWVDEWLGIKP